MNRTVTANDGAIVQICSYGYTDTDGHRMQCRAHAKCRICGQCSKIIEGHETGHCPGHLGLKPEIAVPDRGTV